MIEPAAYGVATCFGPNTQNFRDVVELLLNNQAAVRVSSGEELTAFVRRCLENPHYATELGHNAEVDRARSARRNDEHMASDSTTLAGRYLNRNGSAKDRGLISG